MPREALANAVEYWQPGRRPAPHGRKLDPILDATGEMRAVQPNLRQRFANFLEGQWGPSSGRETAIDLLSGPSAMYDVTRAAAEGKPGEAALEGVGMLPAGKVLSFGGKIAAGVAAAKLAEKLDVKGLGNQLSMFFGPYARTAYKPGLRAAQEYEQLGRDPSTIRRLTDWFRGSEGKWRFESPDTNAALNWPSPQGTPLKDVLIKPELYEAYPQIRDFPVHRIVDDPSLHAGVATDPMTGEAQYMVLNRHMAADPLETALHEAQHLVQGQEGFARGGSPHELFSKQHPAAQFYDQALEDVRKIAPPGTPRMVIEGAAQRKAMFEWYERIAGETEARNVSKRYNLTPEELRLKQPWETQDYPYAEQAKVMATPVPPRLAPKAPRGQPYLPFKPKLPIQWE